MMELIIMRGLAVEVAPVLLRWVRGLGSAEGSPQEGLWRLRGPVPGEVSSSVDSRQLLLLSPLHLALRLALGRERRVGREPLRGGHVAVARGRAGAAPRAAAELPRQLERQVERGGRAAGGGRALGRGVDARREGHLLLLGHLRAQLGRQQ